MRERKRVFMKIVQLAVVLFFSWVAQAEDVSRVIYPRAIQSRSQGRLPVAVFDLDETLVNSTPRRFLSFLRALPALQAQFPQEAAKLKGLRLEHFFTLRNRYSTAETLAAFGIQNAQFQAQLETQFLIHYLSGDWIAFDRDMPCGTALIRDLQKMGVLPVFISSRYASSQLAATLASLKELGITRENEPFRVVLRPDGMSSIDFKKMAFAKVRELGKEFGKPVDVILAAENEPENMNAMTAEFPTATKFFIKGAYLKEETLVMPPSARTLGPFLINHYCR